MVGTALPSGQAELGYDLLGGEVGGVVLKPVVGALNTLPVLGDTLPQFGSRIGLGGADAAGNLGRMGGAGQTTQLDASSASASFQGEHPYYGIDPLENTSYPVGARLVQLTHIPPRQNGCRLL